MTTTSEDLRRLSEQSRVRLASARELRELHVLITRQSVRRLDASRLLLQQRRAAQQGP